MQKLLIVSLLAAACGTAFAQQTALSGVTNEVNAYLINTGASANFSTANAQFNSTMYFDTDYHADSTTLDIAPSATNITLTSFGNTALNHAPLVAGSDVPLSVVSVGSATTTDGFGYGYNMNASWT